MNITIKKRDLIYLAITALVLFVLYIGRDVLVPFILAAIFAYILNPLIHLLNSKIKLPRTAAIALIYLLLIGAVGGGIFIVWTRYAQESAQFSLEVKTFVAQAESQIQTLPDWIQPAAIEGLNSLRHTAVFSPQRLANLLPGAVNRGISVLIFLVAAFYFLKDGHRFVENILNLFPNDLKFESELVLRKVNAILGSYLRAQLLLVLIMSVLTFVCLSIVGVRYALVLSIFTGVAETVPYVGPVIAMALAMIIAFTDGYTRLNADPVIEVLIVGIIYTVLRQFEDLFIIPQILGRMIKLHPLVILFTAFLGGHLFGVLGFLIAVPVVASLKVVFDHTLDLLNKKN